MIDDATFQEAKRLFTEQVYKVRWIKADVDRLLDQRRQAVQPGDDTIVQLDTQLTAKRKELLEAEDLRDEYDRRVLETGRPIIAAQANMLHLLAGLDAAEAQRRYRENPNDLGDPEAELRQVMRDMKDAKDLGDEARGTEGKT
ncbi:MAG: hypothetical protein AVDCRST_MAG77-4954 [uncultured Chloroflexi bacterium]|uniref:Uncharacterized protein n=1 Tax=uncultured Chloroflexota bacterium TaxID=166587 RepID=A0A6J4K2I2_9CHLR|nr:MAG: hypothetical protein AVDCRST_MAG77-4954 [uncultured Chloroflexota bacterium]